jgi:glycosyltransferase involved in cell wall biosynthesis
MAERRTLRRGRREYDVVFYMPWMGPLLAPGKSLPTGGAETQVYLVAQALAASGLRVCVVAFQTPEGLPARVGNVDVFARRPYAGGKRLIGKITETVATWLALARLDTDVIVIRASGPYVGIVGVFARIWRRRFVFSSAHVGDFTFDLEEVGRNLAIYKLGVRLAHTVVVQTEEQVELCREAFGREPVLIKSLAESAETPSEGAPEAFLWVARAIYYKQPLKFLELARRVPEARFRMLAVPEPTFSLGLMDEVKRQAAELPNVELLEPRPRSEVLTLMERAVAVVNTADFEGLPNIFLEGWTRGIPALALAHDPDAIVTRNGIGSFANGSMEQFAEQARELWRKREDMDDMRDRCRRYVKDNHSSEVVVSNWRDVIAALSRSDAIAEARPIGEPDLTRTETTTSEVA